MTRYEAFLYRARHGFGCEPTTIAALSIAAIGSVASIQGQRASASAQEAQQAALTEANTAASIDSMASVRAQQSQEREAAAREADKARLAGRKAASTALVAAGEAGVGGNSVDALLADFKAQEGQYTEALTRQTQINDANADEQVRSIATGANYQNLSINAPIQRPQYFTEALRFGSTALGLYRDHTRGRPTATGKTS